MPEAIASSNVSVPWTIREARNEDVSALVALGQAMHSKSSYAHMSFEAAKFGAALRRWIDLDDHLVLVADGLVGMFVGTVSSVYFGHAMLARDVLFYVSPEHRNYALARAMVERFRAWARAKRVPEVRLGISAGGDYERTGKLYERLGFEQVGALYREKTNV